MSDTHDFGNDFGSLYITTYHFCLFKRIKIPNYKINLFPQSRIDLSIIWTPKKIRGLRQCILPTGSNWSKDTQL